MNITLGCPECGHRSEIPEVESRADHSCERCGRAEMTRLRRNGSKDFARVEAVPPPRKRQGVGPSLLRFVVTVVVAVPLFLAVGWPHPWWTTFLIALASVSAGRGAEALARRGG